MSTLIRPEVSKKHPYHISKHRYYELKHFCLQYPEWKKEYNAILLEMDDTFFDPTGEKAARRKILSDKINMVESCAKEVDEILAKYLFFAVTNDASYTYLRTVMNIPCCKGVYYEAYRKFWWCLSKRRS